MSKIPDIFIFGYLTLVVLQVSLSFRLHSRLKFSDLPKWYTFYYGGAMVLYVITILLFGFYFPGFPGLSFTCQNGCKFTISFF